MTGDPRIPVLFSLADAQEGDALLIERDGLMAWPGPVARFRPSASGHPLHCACCRASSPAAAALRELFQARARGAVGFFRRVIVRTATAQGAASVHAALSNDAFAAARYRLGTSPSPRPSARCM